MTTVDTIPANPEAITPEWLTAALRAGGMSGVTVRSVSAETIGQGAGILCHLARLTVEYDGDAANAPRTMVAKMSTDVPETRQLVGMFRFYEREVAFYKELQNRVPVGTARAYHGQYDPATGDLVLLLEDLASRRIGDQLQGASLADAELIVSELGRLHGTFWNKPETHALDWMPTGDSDTNKAGMSLYPMAWGPFMERLGHSLTPEMVRVGERLGSVSTRILDRFADRPMTVLHGDTRLDNLFFATQPGDPPLSIIDWQISIRSAGPYDVGYFTSQSLQPEVRRQHERDLLRRYHDTLRAQGVNDYTYDQCLEDYRWTLLFCLAYPVMGGGLGDLGNERGMQLVTAMMERSVTAIQDWDAGALLDEL